MPPPDTISEAYSTMKAAFVDTLVANAADALIAGEIRAQKLLRMDINFHLVSSRAVTASQLYKEQLIKYGGSEITEIVDGVPRRVFKPWLDDAIAADKEKIAQIIQDGVKNGTPLRDVERQLDGVFGMQEHSARTTAYTETKSLYNKGTFDRFRERRVQQAEFVHMDPQEHPREDHQQLNGQIFDMDDPVWYLLDEPFCHCSARPILSV